MSEQLTQEEIQQIIDALVGGRKIEAIKIYREATGQGLKEAKDFIETLVPKLIEEDPEKYQSLAKSQRGGCAALLVVVVGLGMITVLLTKTITHLVVFVTRT